MKLTGELKIFYQGKLGNEFRVAAPLTSILLPILTICLFHMDTCSWQVIHLVNFLPKFTPDILLYNLTTQNKSLTLRLS